MLFFCDPDCFRGEDIDCVVDIDETILIHQQNNLTKTTGEPTEKQDIKKELCLLLIIMFIIVIVVLLWFKLHKKNRI